MKTLNVEQRTQIMIDKLCQVWLKSVRATHLFLPDHDIEEIATYIPSALKQITHLIIATDQDNEPIGFMGIEGPKLEMLFIDPKAQGKGIGRQLIEDAVKYYNINEVGVNEQNPKAKGFYEHMGFRVYKRTELDEQGNPYPILYMKLC